MNLVKISSGLVCLVLGSLMVACGGGAASVPPPSTPAAQPPAAQPEAMSQDGMFIGSSCGESWRPEVQQWQSAMLSAIGRDGQYELFDYVFVDGTVYVGLRYASLGLTDAQLEAAHRVESQFAQGPVAAVERDEVLMAHAWATSSGALARAE